MLKPNQAAVSGEAKGDPFDIGTQLADQFCPALERAKADFEPFDLFMLAAGFTVRAAEIAGEKKAQAINGCANCETVGFLQGFIKALETFIEERTTAEHGEAEAEPGRAH